MYFTQSMAIGNPSTRAMQQRPDTGSAKVHTAHACRIPSIPEAGNTMSTEAVRSFFRQYAPDITVTETSAATATVQQAAEVYGVEPGQIAKTLSLRVGEQAFLVVMRGDARLDNKKMKQAFGGRTKMLDPDKVLALTGHPVGGVCPFGLATRLPVYCDVSLRTFDVVLPAAGSTNSAVRITPEKLAELTEATWVDVTSNPG